MSPASEDWQLLLAAAMVKNVGIPKSGSTRSTLAAAHLILGETDDAVRLFERALRDPANPVGTNARMLSDLSAAYLARALNKDRADDYPRALECAAHALEIEPRLSEALFNKALALEALSLPNQAAKTWGTFLKWETDENWRSEARRRLDDLVSRPKPNFDKMGSELRAALEKATDSDLDAMVDANVGIARDIYELELLPQVRAREGEARRLAAALVRVTGDPESAAWLTSDLAEVERAAQRHARCERLTLGGRWAEIEAVSRDPSKVLPANLRLKLHNAAATYQRNVDEALPTVLWLERQAVRHGFRVLRARAVGLRGLIRGSAGQMDEALVAFQEAATVLRAARHHEAADDVESYVADALDSLGATGPAWTSRISSLRRLAWQRERSARVSALAALDYYALDSGWPRVALESLCEAEHEVGRGDDMRSLPSDRLTLKRDLAVAMDRARPGTGLAMILEAEHLLEGIQDPVSRERNRTELMVAAARMSTPAGMHEQHLVLVQRAIQMLESRNAEDRVPEMLLRKAIVQEAAGRTSTEDLARALNLLDRNRPRDLFESKSAESLRGALYERAILLAKDAEAALALATRGHGREGVSAAEPSSIASIQEQLGGDEAIVAYFIGETQAFAWTVRRAAVGMHPLGETALIRRAVEDLRGARASGDSDGAIEALRELMHLVWRPLETEIADAAEIVIVPHGPLYWVPSTAFAGPTEPGQRYVVSFSPSIDFAIRRFDPSPLRSLALFAIPEASGMPLLHTVGRGLSASMPQIAPPSASRADLDRIDSLLLEHDAVLIAAHATFWPRRPDLSGIVLPDGRVWKVAEIARARLAGLRMALVFGCETAAPHGEHGGGASLLRGFLSAGAEAVVGPVGRIRDSTASLLSEAIVKELAKQADLRRATVSATTTAWKAGGSFEVVDISVFAPFSKRGKR